MRRGKDSRGAASSQIALIVSECMHAHRSGEKEYDGEQDTLLMWGICAKGVQNSLSLSCNFKSEINSEYKVGGKGKQQRPGLLRASLSRAPASWRFRSRPEGRLRGEVLGLPTLHSAACLVASRLVSSASSPALEMTASARLACALRTPPPRASSAGLRLVHPCPTSPLPRMQSALNKHLSARADLTIMGCRSETLESCHSRFPRARLST